MRNMCSSDGYAVVVDSVGNKMVTLMDGVQCLAGASTSSYTVQWSGVDGSNYLVTNPGKYSFVVTAVDRSGNTSSLKRSFSMLFKDGIIEAPPVASHLGDIVPKLTMDQAFIDSSGKTRYIGMPDYLLKATVSGKILPDSERTLKYHWNLSGTQIPAIYEASRFSLGIRRQRTVFPVTMVTVVMAEGHHFVSVTDLKHPCDKESPNTYYQVSVSSRNFGAGLGYDYAIDPNIDDTIEIKNTGMPVIGYDHDGTVAHPFKVYVMLFPSYSISEIQQ